MAEGFALKAAVRERTGKGAARALRREGLIPAVIYGNNEPPVAIALPHKEMSLALYAGGFLTNVWTLDVDGQPVQALARDFQREPLKDRLVHVDFLRVDAKSRVTVDVPLSFVGEEESPGLEEGGVLSIIQHNVSLIAPATRIPNVLEVSVAGKQMGDTLTSDDLSLPADVEYAMHDYEAFPIASITAPVEEVPEEDPEAPDAPEVEGEEPAEGEAAEGESATDDETES
ncbi:50S ribosomal protein L25/general stress protein Ctc [Acuticoccus sp. MNP-M23]|uniref:50S ribosomal protein L25/general stress protein Ctc n=1 Tax=Acuticoccus sp. MNP-M23 TaxID=3072793 RepID=UPI00281518A2|nr:50S ribosomal protein L25/general stress protein Ctc [Acuticoccus sp. MNP-M23]WMS42721.1 50S ribosomal protein L25/general stress protein Ctc [Acuticoccus sp. MNP-M23]